VANPGPPPEPVPQRLGPTCSAWGREPRSTPFSGLHRAQRTDLGPGSGQLLPGLALHPVEAQELV